MSLDISGKNVKLWVNEHEGKNGGKFNSYAISVSRKLQNGEYVNKSVRLTIGKEVYIPDNLGNGATIDFDGFLTLNVYTDRNGNEQREVQIYATSVDFNDLGTPTRNDVQEEYTFAEVEEDIPF